MNFLWADLLYAWRTARRSPGVTLAIIAMLALGTGGVTAVFNPIYSQIFAPLPFPQPEQLVRIGGDIPLFNSRFNKFERREELDRIFSNLTAYAPVLGTSIILPDTGKNLVVYEVEVSEEFFETLGVAPLSGSDFRHSKERRAVVVSNRFWRNELIGAEDAIGKQILAFGLQHSIIGIMPESFDFPTGTDIWTYRAAERETVERITRQYLGRLHSEIYIGKAAEELRALEFKPGAGLFGNAGPAVQSLRTILYGDRRPMLLMLGATAVLFLLLVCAGVMSLLVTQGTRRKSEMAIRLIHGATRRSLVFQLLRETLPLVVIAALAGVWLSEVASSWLMAEFPTLQGGEVVLPVKMAFFAALVFATTIIGGLTPALYATGVDLNTYLKSGSNTKRRFGPFSFSLRELLVGVQLGLSLALLTGVGLLVNSLMFHVDVPIRWSSQDMAVVQVAFSKAPMFPEEVTHHAMYFQEFKNRLSTIPEVAKVGIFNPIPFSQDAVRIMQNNTGVYKTPRTAPDLVFTRAIWGWVSPDGFEMLGIPLLSGRNFSQTDMDNAVEFERVNIESIVTTGMMASFVGGTAIVNQSLARQLWQGENVVGKIIYDSRFNAYEVVGITPDFHWNSKNKDFVAAIFFPAENYRRTQTFLVRLHSGALVKDFAQRLSGFNDGLVTIEVQSLGEIVSDSMVDTRMTFQLLGCFALLGIVVAGLSAYATTSLMVAAMNREIGIRIAMGATARNIFMFILWRGIRVILIVVPIGLFLAWILSKVLSGFLFQVKVGDPLAWIISCTVLLVITVIAVLIPALRATHVNPLDAIRSE